ncbi:type IV secretory system conjugative DNA transfer family protein [Streptomyces sp. bgisy034]|uniref:type IV secretory system conjugative DNA transfer family protein n=1 Tax=Streptomyces sp. bgisy034 TaxID=3413774 RepID=UPI003EB8A368
MTRQTYYLTFPSDLTADHVTTWLRAVSGTLRTGPRRLLGVPSIVLEVRAEDAGISYRCHVPREHADYLIPQLRSLIPGSTAEPASGEEPPHVWTAAVELGQADSRRSAGVVNAEALSASMLTTMQGLGRGEALLLQWVVSPAMRERPSAMREATEDGGVFGKLLGGEVDRDQLKERRAKLAEPNLLAVLRVAVKADSTQRSRQLVSRVRSSIASVGGASNAFRKRLTTTNRVVRRVQEAAAPTVFPAVLAASELAGLMAWPIGSPHVAGLPQSRTRQLAATGAISRTGRVLARSNFPGNARLLALSPSESTWHLQVVGPTGSGKTALLTNLIYQDMNAGRGVVLIESKGDLYNAVLDRVPEHRKPDVVLLDVSDTAYPVGWNLLQGSPYVVAADIQRLFDHLYPQDARGVRVRAGFYHLILTLMLSREAHGQMTFADIQPLAVPRPDQEEFSRRLVRGVSHLDELAGWWLEITSLGRPQRNAYFKPLLDRVWQLSSRPSLRNIIGQSTSTIDLGDIIRQGKILLVNLGRATEGKDTAGLLGSLLLNSVWSAVQAGAANPARPTMLYLDEFQDLINLPIPAGDMFAQARSLGLAMTVAHQFLGQLTRELQDATQANARSTVVFQTSTDEARSFARQFGRSVTEDDFTSLARFEVIARIATLGGVSSPVTGVTLPPVEPTGLANEVRRLSCQSYGRPVAEVEAEIKQRRGQRPAPGLSTRRPRFGGPR